MTEVRSVASRGLGLFATEEYAIGDVLLSEDAPLIQLAPTSSNQEERILADWQPSSQDKSKGRLKEDSPSLWNAIDPPESVKEELHGKFKGMAQAALCFADVNLAVETQEKLLQLYHPSLIDTEPNTKDIVELSQLALDFVQKSLTNDSNLQKALADSDRVRKVMLVWSANSFDGGRIYQLMSRVNHSCNPNAVVIAKGDQQKLVAAAPIALGEEITISYLGLWLYSERRMRRRVLLNTKHFDCACERCSKDPDLAYCIPCPVCHVRQGRGELDEDVQYDDDQTVHYVCPQSECDACHTRLTRDNAKAKQAMDVTESVADKVMTFLRDYEATQKRQVDDQEDEAEVLVGELLAQNLSLASSVAGAKHWSTNLVMMIQLDRTLQVFHAEMLSEGAGPDTDALAEAIDMLQRLCRFVDGLNLKLHCGHLLSDLMIGVARALVSLGDIKSQKYASEWCQKLEGYVQHFEPEGIQKVVETLQVAWARHDETLQQDSPQQKRAKTS